MTAGRGDDALLTNAKQAGAGFGMITDAAGLAKIEEGKELDEAQQRNMKVLMAVVNTGLAIPQAGAGPFTAGAVGAWTGMIEDAPKGMRRPKPAVTPTPPLTRPRPSCVISRRRPCSSRSVRRCRARCQDPSLGLAGRSGKGRRPS